MPGHDGQNKMRGQERNAFIVSYRVSDVERALREKEFIYQLNRLNVSTTRAQPRTVAYLTAPRLPPNHPERVVRERYVVIHPTDSESMSTMRHRRKRRWRDYRTSSGRRPIKRFIVALPTGDQAAIAAAMKDIQIHGNVSAHHLWGDIYEVGACANKRQYRILFSTEGRSDQVLLSIHAIVKTTRAVPRGDIDLAERRLRDWRSRGSRCHRCTVDSMPYST